MYNGLSTIKQEEFIYETTKGVAKNFPEFLIRKDSTIYLLLNALSREIYKLANYIEEVYDRRGALTDDDFKRLSGEEVFKVVENFSQIYTSLDTEKTVLKRHAMYNSYIDGSKKQIESILTDLKFTNINPTEPSNYIYSVKFTDEIEQEIFFTDETTHSIYFINYYALPKDKIKIELSYSGTVTDDMLISLYKIIRFFLPRGIIFTIEVV